MPKPSHQTIDTQAVATLMEGRAIQGAALLGQPGGWAVLIRYGDTERIIAAQRSGQVRLWRDLNTAVAYVRDALGVSRFEIDASGHDAEAKPRRRPDTAERQRRQHEAAAHDRWFRSQVQAALDGAADGTNPLIEDEDWAAISEAERAALKARIVSR